MRDSKLFVGNLDYSVTKEQLETLFAEYGDVKSVTIIDGRGFGFVEMSEPEEAERAKDALNEAGFQGRTLRVDEARPPKKRYDWDDYGGHSEQDSRERSGRGNRGSRSGKGSRGSRGGRGRY